MQSSQGEVSYSCLVLEERGSFMRKHNRGETAVLGPARAGLLKMTEKEPGLLSQLGQGYFLAAPAASRCPWPGSCERTAAIRCCPDQHTEL